MENEKAILYQLSESTTTQMMSYVLLNSENRIVVIDGGNDGDGETLFQFLQQLGGPKPVVDAWLLTHFHGDHINALTHILREHSAQLEIRAVYYNFPSPQRALEETPAEAFTVDGFAQARKHFADREIILHTGDEFAVGNLRFKVLFMPYDWIETNVVNNCSTVLRCDIGDQRVLFLGDLGSEVSEQFLAMWPEDELRADYVQMAHHGQSGVTREVYERIRPRVCLWPTPKWLWENDIGGGRNSGPWKTLEVRRWMEELQVQRHVISHEGLQEIRFP